MPLQRFGTGFLKGLTQVAGQAKADLRAEEDTESRNNLAMAQLALQSGDPVLIQGALDRLTDDFGGGKKRAGGRKRAGGAGGGADPKSMIAQLLLGGLDRGDGGAAAGGQAPLRIQTAEEKAALEQSQATAATEGLVARMRDQQNPDGTPMFTTEQIAAAVGSQMGVPAGPTGFAPVGSVPFTAGVPGEQIPPRPTTPPNVQTMTGNRPDDPPNAPPRLFERDRATGQWRDSRDGQLVTGEIQQRRAPGQGRDPIVAEINRMRRDTLRETAATKRQYAEIPPEWRTAFEKAILSVAPTRQPGERALMARLWSENNLPGVRELIQQAAVEGSPAVIRQRFEGRREAIRQIDDLGVALDELEDAGVDTGPISGGMEGLARKIGTSTDTRLAALGNQMLVALQSYRLAVTGVQFGFNESQQYEGMFPSYLNQPPLNRGLLAGLRRAMSLNQQGFWKDKLGEEGAALVGAPGADGQDSALRLRARQFLIDSGRKPIPENIDYLLALPDIEAQLPAIPQ